MRSWEAVIYQYFARSTPTNTLCEADIYQYPLRNGHLPVLFMKPASTSTHYKAIIYQYCMVQENSFSIVRGADYSIVRVAVFSIVQSVVFSIVRDDTFSIVQSNAFVEILYRLLGPRWRCSANRSEVLGKAWGWWRLCGELNSWIRLIAQMRLCAVSGDQVRWPGQ